MGHCHPPQCEKSSNCQSPQWDTWISNSFPRIRSSATLTSEIVEESSFTLVFKVFSEIVNNLKLFRTCSQKSETTFEFSSIYHLYPFLALKSSICPSLLQLWNISDCLLCTRMHNLCLILFANRLNILQWELLSSTVLVLESYKSESSTSTFEQVFTKLFSRLLLSRLECRQDTISLIYRITQTCFTLNSLFKLHQNIHFLNILHKSVESVSELWTVNKKLNRRKTIIGHRCYAHGADKSNKLCMISIFKNHPWNSCLFKRVARSYASAPLDMHAGCMQAACRLHAAWKQPSA